MTNNSITNRSLLNLFDALIQREIGSDNELTIPAYLISKPLMINLVNQAKTFVHDNDRYKHAVTKDIINRLIDGQTERTENSANRALNLTFTF
jgi:hypothetical protein